VPSPTCSFHTTSEVACTLELDLEVLLKVDPTAQVWGALYASPAAFLTHSHLWGHVKEGTFTALLAKGCVHCFLEMAHDIRAVWEADTMPKIRLILMPYHITRSWVFGTELP
jgi:hypothetical protein